MGFGSWQGQDIIFSRASRTALWPRQPPIVTGGSFLDLKRSEHEADLSSQSSHEIKNEWVYTSTPPKCLLGLDRDNFTFGV